MTSSALKALYSLAIVATAGCATKGQTPTGADPLAQDPNAEAATAVAMIAPEPPLQDMPAPTPTEDTDADEADVNDNRLDGDEPVVEPEDFGQDLAAEREGFCIDDLYTRYLVEQYKMGRASKPTTQDELVIKTPDKHVRKRGRHARHMINTRKVEGTAVEALFHAKGRMVGKSAPYFGAMPIVTNEMVELWVQYYKTAGRREFMRWLVRGESVKRVVQPLLQQGGIPIEFFYLAMVESGFSNSAYSSARATGTWQFMQGTAKLYGLKINHWVDERRDPVKSSIAAANYLRDLYKELGDWYLAMAAYNAGPGRIRKAIRLGGTRNFWELASRGLLPRETTQYVPKVLAAVLLATDRSAHGFEVQANPTDHLPDTEVIVRRPVRLDELAVRLGVPTRTLVEWNPELIRNVVPPSKTGYALRLSSKYANAFPQVEQRLSMIEISDVQLHRVERGDTLSGIARRYNCDVRQIMTLNPELKVKALKVGKDVAVPAPGVITSKGKGSESA